MKVEVGGYVKLLDDPDRLVFKVVKIKGDRAKVVSPGDQWGRVTAVANLMAHKPQRNW